jgi:hypothetical protein
MGGNDLWAGSRPAAGNPSPQLASTALWREGYHPHSPPTPNTGTQRHQAHLQHAGACCQHVLPGEGATVQPQCVPPRLEGDGRGIGDEVHRGAGAPGPSCRQAVHRQAELAVGRRRRRRRRRRGLGRLLLWLLPTRRRRWRGGTHPTPLLLSEPVPELSGWVCCAASAVRHLSSGWQGGAGGRERGVAPIAIWHVADVGMARWGIVLFGQAPLQQGQTLVAGERSPWYRLVSRCKRCLMTKPNCLALLSCRGPPPDSNNSIHQFPL